MDDLGFGTISSISTGFFFALMILVVLTLIISIYAAVRSDKIWQLMKRQQDLAEIKKELSLELKSKTSS